jgi:hypothetical protein
MIAAVERRQAVDDTTQGAGWVAFAGIMILIAAVLNVIWGIGANRQGQFLYRG